MKKSFILFVFLFSTINLFSQVEMNDTIYLLNGNKMEVMIVENYRDLNNIYYVRWDKDTNVFNHMESISINRVHSIYSNSEYIIINDITNNKDINLELFRSQSNTAYITTGIGIGLVLLSDIVSEAQANKFKKTGNIDSVNNLPKYLRYTGLCLSLTGVIIRIDANKHLKKNYIEIGLNNIRYNF